MISVDLA